MYQEEGTCMTIDTKSLAEIRHLLVLAAQQEYDARIARGIHPYAMASYHFEKCIYEELNKHVDISDWKAGNWHALQKARDFYEYEIVFDKYNQNVGPLSNGLWAVSACISSTAAWATPGFAEAYANHCRENN